MRIALISSTLPPEGRGGAEAYVAALATSLSAEHDVAVLTGAPPGDSPGVEYVPLPRLAPIEPGASMPYKLGWHARDQWLPSVHRAVARALHRFRPDVVHSHQPQGLSAAVFTATASADLPHVHTAHDLNLLCARTSMTRDGERCGGRCALCLVQRRVRASAVRRHIDFLLAPSEYMCERHVEAGVVPRRRAIAVRLGTDAVDARPRRLPGTGLRLGFIGTLGRHKGVPTLLAAFGNAPADWTLAIAGSGPLEDRVRAAAAADPRITYHGYLTTTAKDGFFDGVDILVVPSEWEEPGTFVCIEAAARGIPAVVSDRGGLPENPQARVFASGDAAALLRAVQAYEDVPETYAEVSARLVAAHPEFLWTTHAARVERVLAQAVRERPGTSGGSLAERDALGDR